MMLLGELRGQVRELVHGVNNLRQDVGTVFDKMAAQQSVPADIVRMEAEIAAIEVRVTALEVAEHQRRGALSLGAVLLKTVPWLVPAGFGGAMVAVVAELLK